MASRIPLLCRIQLPSASERPLNPEKREERLISKDLVSQERVEDGSGGTNGGHPAEHLTLTLSLNII